MKKTAILIYDQFCNFEIAPALEMLAMAEKPITIFAKTLSRIRSEDGLTIIPEKSIDELNLNEYDSLLLPGALLRTMQFWTSSKNSRVCPLAQSLLPRCFY